MIIIDIHASVVVSTGDSGNRYLCPTIWWCGPPRLQRRQRLLQNSATYKFSWNRASQLAGGWETQVCHKMPKHTILSMVATQPPFVTQTLSLNTNNQVCAHTVAGNALRSHTVCSPILHSATHPVCIVENVDFPSTPETCQLHWSLVAKNVQRHICR